MEGSVMSVSRVPMKNSSVVSEKAKRWIGYCGEALAILALIGGLYWYMELIQTVPECALDNHHGAGNCPVQLLVWYPHNVIETW
jgi:hypothetical protein